MDRKNLSLRGQMWLAFSDDVLHHIESYTVPQYGDAPTDLASSWSEKEMLDNLGKYIHRAKSSMRPDCRLTDLLKMSHYCQMIYHKRQEEDHQR